MSDTSIASILLACGLLTFYFAAYAVGGVVRYTLPLIGIVIAALVMGRFDIAMGAVMAGAVASVGLAGGMVFLQGGGGGGERVVGGGGVGGGALVVPVGVALIVVGVTGRMSVTGVVALWGLGASVLWALSGTGRARGGGAGGEVRLVAEGSAVGGGGGRSGWVTPVLWLLGIGVASLGGWAAVEGVHRLARAYVHLGGGDGAGVLASCILGPMAVMPLLGAAATMAEGGGRTHVGSDRDPPAELPVNEEDKQESSAEHRATGLHGQGDWPGALRLCLWVGVFASAVLFPTVGFLRMIWRVVAMKLGEADQGGIIEAVVDSMREGAMFPLSIWRVECVLLTALGAFLIPIAVGRYKPTRRDGMVLLGVYTLYLLLSAVSGVRR